MSQRHQAVAQDPLRRSRPAIAGETALLKDALVQSKDAQQKVVAVADALETTNDHVRGLISEGTEVLPAEDALAMTEKVESDVKEVAGDLDRVNGALSNGVEHVEVLKKALNDSEVLQRQTEAKLLESEHDGEVARDRALHDAATGLPNRALFDDRLTHAISMAERRAWTLAVLFLDLDRFKDVNDRHGHGAGDVVLKEVARRLALHSRDEDTVCRYGGDEFLFLLINPQGADNVARIAAAVAASIAEPVDIGTARVQVGSSIGVALYPEHGETGPQLVEYADAAMYAVKRERLQPARG